MILPIAILAAATLYIGLNAERVVHVAEQISNELMDTTPYINAVLGTNR